MKTDASILAGPAPGGVARRGGFSLFELMVVTAIVAVVSAIAMPRFGASIQRYRASAAAARVVADLALAQLRANGGSAALTVAFTPATNSYQIVGMADPDRPATTYTVSLGSEPYNATLVSASFGNASRVTYDGYGVVSGGGSVVLTVGDAQRTIVVDADSGKGVVQ